MVKVTEHAILRSKERCGLNRKAAERMAEVAWEKRTDSCQSAPANKKVCVSLIF